MTAVLALQGFSTAPKRAGLPTGEGGTAFDAAGGGVVDASAPGFGKGVFERGGVHVCGAYSSGGA